DLFPTMAELAGVPVPSGIALDGRSLVPVLRKPDASWPDRQLFTHLGRWPKGKASEWKYAQCRVRDAQYSLVNTKPEKNWELYELSTDPGEQRNLARDRQDIVARMDQAYDRWWNEILPNLDN